MNFYDLLLAQKLSGGGGGGGGGTDYLQQKVEGTLTVYRNDNITSIVSKAFASFSSMEEVYVHNITSMAGNSWFDGCSKLKSIALPKYTGALGSAAFQGCSSLASADFACSGMSGTVFNNASSLSVIVLRKTSLVSLGGTNVFSGTPFKNGGTGGEIYIPKSLYDHLGDNSANDYKAASNWSTVDGYGTITWKKIEGSIYETAYADGTPISA